MMAACIRIKQHDISDCGAACIASVASFYGCRIPISRIRQLSGTDQKGTNLMGMIEAAEKLGFVAKGVRIDIKNLPDVPFPAIAHTRIENNWHHFVVILKIKKDKIKIMDPATGEFHYRTYDEFKKTWTNVLLLMIPAEDANFKQKNISKWQRFFGLIKPHRSILIQSLTGAIFYSILGLASSIYVEKLIDYVIPGMNSKLLNIMSLSLFLLIIFRVFIGFTKSMFMLKTGQKIDSVLILGYYRHLMRLPLRFFETMRTGEIISRINDAVKIRAFINTIAVEMMVSILIVVFSFILMFIYSKKLALNMIVIIPVFILVYIIYNRLNKRHLRTTMEQSADLESQLVESLNAMSTIKRFKNSGREIRKFENKFVALLKSSFTVNKNTVFAIHANEFFSGTFLLILLWTGTFKIFRRELTTGELMSFYALFGYLLTPLTSIVSMNRSVQDALIAADRLFNILDLEQETEVTHSMTLQPGEIQKIKVENISFRYGSGTAIFDNLCIEVQQGSFVGIAGESGSGKSTLLNLLQGIYQPNSGKIYIGDCDIRYVSKDSIKRIVSCVPQQIDIFSGSVLENIAISDQLNDINKAIRVCKKTGIEALIRKLPDGMHTIIGEKGIRLSGGEQQKIALARALYSDPEVLILDEPGSSLDYFAEESMIDLLLQLKQEGKTIILVTHRLSSIENCDSVFLLNNGKICESGNHKELLFRKGHYYELWKRQFREVITVN